MNRRSIAIELVAEGLWYAMSEAPDDRAEARAAWTALPDAERDLWRDEAGRVVAHWLDEATAQERAA